MYPRFPASPLAADALFDIDSRFRARERRTPPVGAALSGMADSLT